MLTRYRELYNNLTVSKAFTESGVIDNKKVNKNNFTPNNLKAIILGADGVVVVYYTTNNTNTKLVNYLPFTKLPKTEEEFAQSLKSEKGMIDALCDGLKFSNVEEIFLCTEGFNPVEAEREYARLLVFVKNKLLREKSFKRLRGIALIKAPLTPDYASNINNESTIAAQLKKANLPTQALASFEPETNDLGLLKNIELDNGEYKLDAKFNPDADAKERDSQDCRLSRYFYMLEQKARKAKEDAEKTNAEATRQVSNQADKQQYIQHLLSLGFKHITNKEKVAGSTEVFNSTLNWLKSFCTEKPNEQTGYKYKTCEFNQALLKSKGIADVKNANIFNSSIFTLDEDLRFRLFVNENALSYTILIKLPTDLDEFNFETKENLINNICSIFSNRDKANGKVFQSSIYGSPKLIGLKNYGCSTVYDAIELILVKDLMGFRKSGWGFLEYLKACNGDKNVFTSFPKLPLGEKIVVGVKPDSLKTESFNCSGQQQTSGLICGAAGSGKSALIDNLIVQFLALKGNYGNGAVVLMDAKQELPNLWKPTFNRLGIPFYGFDGGIIVDQDSIKQRVKKNGKEVITGFNQPISQEVGGMIFMVTLYEVIQNILKISGYKDVAAFNKANTNVDGITRLPRIAIMIDEMNTFAINTKGDLVAKGIIEKITGGANLTRTSGFMWFLCGQDIPKSIVSSEKRGSFKYNIFGAMQSERYEYFGVKENQEVRKYEDKYGTPENPRPIMSQGSFYAGQQGSTELVRSMFLADEEKDEALALLNSQFEGMWELDALVKYALKNHLFDNYTYGVGNKNNIIYAVLRDIGIINDAEFEEATARVLGEQSNPSNIEFDEEVDFNFDERSDNESSQQTQSKQSTQTGPKPQSQQSQSGQNQQQTSRPQTQQNINPMSTSKPKTYTNAYTKQLDIPQGKNPFMHYRGDGTVSTLNQLKEMTKLILQDISSVFGGLDRVATFRVTEEGILIINDTGYQPAFDTNFLESLPFSIQGKVSSGCVAELFDLSKVYQFKNLQSLIIDSQTLCQGRARREFGLKPRERYNVLFKVFRQLQYINAGGVEYRGYNPDEVIDDTRDTLKGYGFKDRMKRLLPDLVAPRPAKSESRMNDFWQSKQMKLLTNAAGWTGATYAVYLSAVLLGPIGLLFGAFAMHGAYKNLKPQQQQNPQQRPQQHQQNKSSSRNQGRYRDSYRDDYDDYDRQGRRPNHNVNYRNNQNGQSRSNNNRNNRQHNSYYK